MTVRLSVIQSRDDWVVWDWWAQDVLYRGTRQDCLRFMQMASKQLELDLFSPQ